jgi:hypothetical protein
MGNTIFREQKFICGGCGKAKDVKLQVPAAQRTDPIAPPKGWYEASFTAQSPETGAIGAVVAYCCSMACANQAAALQGASKPLIEKFQAVFTPAQEPQKLDEPSVPGA